MFPDAFPLSRSSSSPLPHITTSPLPVPFSGPAAQRLKRKRHDTTSTPLPLSSLPSPRPPSVSVSGDSLPCFLLVVFMVGEPFRYCCRRWRCRQKHTCTHTALVVLFLQLNFSLSSEIAVFVTFFTSRSRLVHDQLRCELLCFTCRRNARARLSPRFSLSLRLESRECVEVPACASYAHALACPTTEDDGDVHNQPLVGHPASGPPCRLLALLYTHGMILVTLFIK